VSVDVVDLVLVEQFLNTLDERTFSWHGKSFVPSDSLTSAQDLSAWLEPRGLLAQGARLQTRDLAAALSLRGALRDALAGGADPALTARALARFPLRLAPDESGRLRVTAATGVAGLDGIIETVAVSVADGSWSRLKLCASSDCQRAFYDTSRSGGGRWCSMEACGNRHKTRAYRQRQADGPEPGA
jgi:predicted RNA-binding Zn ribbon-like protein